MKKNMINQLDKEGWRHGHWVDYYDIDYYDNGQLLYKGEFKNGMRHGLWERYQPNGQPWAKGEFKNEKLIGLWYKYED